MAKPSQNSQKKILQVVRHAFFQLAFSFFSSNLFLPCLPSIFTVSSFENFSKLWAKVLSFKKHEEKNIFYRWGDLARPRILDPGEDFGRDLRTIFLNRGFFEKYLTPLNKSFKLKWKMLEKYTSKNVKCRSKKSPF